VPRTVRVLLALAALVVCGSLHLSASPDPDPWWIGTFRDLSPDRREARMHLYTDGRLIQRLGGDEFIWRGRWEPTDRRHIQGVLTTIVAMSDGPVPFGPISVSFERTLAGMVERGDFPAMHWHRVPDDEGEGR
jgi:hypothetical protein